MALRLTPLDCGRIEGTERSAHQYLTGFGEKICSQSILWVIEGGPFPVVVDLPTSRPELIRERFGRTWVQSEAQRPRAAIATLGIDPDEVRAVVLSHLHWDHSIGIEDNPFPNADIYIQLEELRYAAAPYPPHAGLYDPLVLKKLLPAGSSDYPNVTVLNGDFRIFPGLRVLHLPGHTPGLQGVVVTTADGEVGMASDTIPFHSSCCGPTMKDWIPQGIHVSLDDCYRSMARALHESDRVLPSHDPAVIGGTLALGEAKPYGNDS